MRRSVRGLWLSVVSLTLLSACDGNAVGPDSGLDASVIVEDACAPSLPDAQAPEPRPDAAVTPDASDDAGPGAPDASSPCEGMSCAQPDLVVTIPAAELSLSYRTVQISEDDCELFEGCVGGLGLRYLLEIDFTLRNEGEGALELGRPFESPLYYPSFCQDSYVIDGFFEAQIYDEDDHVVSSGRMSTSCIAGAGGEYTCRAQGIAPGEAAAQPTGRCDFLDVTGLADGNYTLVVTANPDHLVAESDFANNSADLWFHYTPCEGTVCGRECCPAGVACVQDTCMLPDLRINEDSAAESIWISHQTFGEDSCELSEMCVNGSGRRRLLQFEGRIENWGPGDLNPGPEAGNPLYEYSECHEHYHFLDFTDYRLVHEDGSVAALGHKQSFCLVDMVQVAGATGPSPIGTRPPPGETGCSYLSAGWADIYGVGTPCQWVDITDVPEGDYVLELTVNPEGKVLEANTDNNVVRIPVHVAQDVPCVPEPEICGDDIDQDCDDQPDTLDPDCYACAPFDPYCDDIEQVANNDSCDDAHVMLGSDVTFEAWIESDDAAEITPACGGQGGDVFFDFALDHEQAVYLGTLGSTLDTVLALYASDCDGEPLGCVDDSCSGSASQLVRVLPAGNYMVAVKAKDPGASGSVRLKLQRADAHGAIVLSAPGVYAGDTRASDDSVQACDYGGDAGVAGTGGGGSTSSAMDGGVDTSGEACVHVAEANGGAALGHSCLHCACDADSGSISACGPACWSLIDCVADECSGDSTDLGCVLDACSSYISGATQAQSAMTALQHCPDSCPLRASDAGVSGGAQLEPAADDVYVVAACQQGITVSTCGTAAFESVIDVRSGSLDGPTQACSAFGYGMCDGDALGTAINADTPSGLTFIVIDGTGPSASGEYQMSVIY